MKDDLISRQAAIDAIHNLYAIHGSEGSWIDQKDAFKALNSLPSAQPTVDAEPVRHAHWIWKGDEGDSRFMCSECGGKEYVPTCMGIPNIWEYCPNCGAKMQEYELERKRIERKEE